MCVLFHQNGVFLMKRLKVLMLGWEFPPLINGGLGIACFGMAKALAKYADLHIIIPRSDPEYQLQNITLTGLNNLKPQDLRGEMVQHWVEEKEDFEYVRILDHYETFAKVEEIPINIDPYNDWSEEKKVVRFGTTQRQMPVIEQSSRPKRRQLHGGGFEDINEQEMLAELEIFKQGELYDKSVQQRVYAFAKYAAKLAQHLDFDVIHAHDWMTVLAGAEIKKISGKPLVWHAHALMYDRAGPEGRGFIYDVEKFAMEIADAIVPVSYYTGTIIHKYLGIQSRKIYPIHNGVDPVKVFHEPKRFPEKLVLFLGRITGQKGPETFLEIAEKVINKTDKVRFVMAGDGDRLKRLIEGGAYKQVGNKFHFTGFLDREKVNKLLAMADVYCMPSVSEPLGLSALEAAQFGIPTVISKQSGAAEVMTHALKADFWDINLMAKQIVELIENEPLKDKIVAESFKDLQKLTWEHCAEKLVKVFAKVIHEQGQNAA